MANVISLSVKTDCDENLLIQLRDVDNYDVLGQTGDWMREETFLHMVERIDSAGHIFVTPRLAQMFQRNCERITGGNFPYERGVIPLDTLAILVEGGW